MPSVRYYNQTAPFWDFVASMEEQGANHPFFGGNNNNNGDGEHQRQGPWPGAWSWGMPHRPGHPHAHPPPPSPPPPPAPPGEDRAQAPPEYDDPPVSQPDEGEPGPSQPHHPGHRHHAHPRRCGGGGGGGGGRGRAWGWGGRGRGGPFGGGPRGPFFGENFPFNGPLAPLADMFQGQSQFFGGNEKDGDKAAEDFKPEVDVFDTSESFVLHISLPGAKREDVGVDWDAEKSEVRIAGVVYRPGDEDFLKSLALDERKIGAFERKVRLGSRANPAQVDADAITAKLEDGVLRIEVPKLDTGYVEIKKVDIE